MQLSGNKGEWSEIYVLIKLLSELKLFSADEDLNKTTSYLDILSIIRSDIKDYNYTQLDSKSINVIEAATSKVVFTITREELSILSENIFKEIKKSEGSSFKMNPHLSDQLQSLFINKLKEDSKNKGDINILVHDPTFGISTRKKFSIKSFIGSTPTLFNANKTTNIIYEITDSDNFPMPSEKINAINIITTHQKYIDRVKAIVDLGYTISFKNFEDRIFKLNLEIIDSKLPEIIAFAVLEKYQSRITKMSEVIDNLTLKNPLNYDLESGHKFYEYRMINFLVEASLGMTSKAVWNGFHDATGGIIIVKNDSDILCYHLIEFNKFKAYLKKSTKLDNPSGGRMGYGEIYSEGGKSLIKLNFQIKA